MIIPNIWKVIKFMFHTTNQLLINVTHRYRWYQPQAFTATLCNLASSPGFLIWVHQMASASDPLGGHNLRPSRWPNRPSRCVKMVKLFRVSGWFLVGFWLVSGWWNPIHNDLLEKTCTVRTRNPCSRGSRFGNLADYPSSDKPAATRRDDAATLHLPTYEILWANIMVVLWGLYRTNFHVLKHVLDKHSASACWMAMTTTHGWSKWVLPLYGRHVLPSKMMWSVVCRQLIGMKIGFSWYSDVIYWILLKYGHVCLPYSVIFWCPYIYFPHLKSRSSIPHCRPIVAPNVMISRRRTMAASAAPVIRRSHSHECSCLVLFFWPVEYGSKSFKIYGSNHQACCLKLVFPRPKKRAFYNS